MERLTTKREWKEAKEDLANEYGYSHIWNRLREIEDILGDDYDLDRLREQVEKVWRGEWKCQSDCGVTECTACKWNIEEYCGDYNFCPHCGAPMNDEAIQMVMERLEALKDE